MESGVWRMASLAARETTETARRFHDQRKAELPGRWSSSTLTSSEKGKEGTYAMRANLIEVISHFFAFFLKGRLQQPADGRLLFVQLAPFGSMLEVGRRPLDAVVAIATLTRATTRERWRAPRHMGSREV